MLYLRRSSWFSLRLILSDRRLVFTLYTSDQLVQITVIFCAECFDIILTIEYSVK